MGTQHRLGAALCRGGRIHPERQTRQSPFRARLELLERASERHRTRTGWANAAGSRLGHVLRSRPAPPLQPQAIQRTFRFFWDYAGGTITDFGTHRFDTVHQIMGVERPRKVAASGGRFELNDAGEMPDIHQVTYEYPGFVLSYESSNISEHGLGGRTPGMKYYHGTGTDDRPHGEAFYGTNGAIFSDRIGFEIYPDNDKIERRWVQSRDTTAEHTAKFIASVRSRKPSNADIEVGHRATLIGHLGNIALKTG